MGKYHNKSYQIERIMRRLNKKDATHMRADEIDLHPLVAIMYCLMILCENCNNNYWHIINKLCQAMDEVCCIIGNRKMDDIFDFELQDRIILGNTNAEYLDNLIRFLKDNYNIVMKKYSRFSMFY